jgi:hypothetical protein
MSVFCTPENVQAISEITAMCRNSQVIAVDSYIYNKDRDKAEEIKIWTFIRMMSSLTNKEIGIPLTPTKEKMEGNTFEVEKWPLVQAYGLEGISFLLTLLTLKILKLANFSPWPIASKAFTINLNYCTSRSTLKQLKL